MDSTHEHCPLCGHDFDPAGAGCRPSCPLAKGCRVLCCPACGYSFPRESAGLAGRLRKALDVLGRGRKVA
jgi:hypothetical protein